MPKDDPQEPKPPKTPEELQKVFQDFFGKFGNVSFEMGGMNAPEAPAEDGEPETVVKESQPIFDFDLLPRDVKRHLDRFVIRQDEAKKALSIAVCDHYNHAKQMRALEEENGGQLPDGMEYQKQNVMIVGPTGVGKTYLVKHIADLIGVPFVKADATKFSETGYVGGDVDDLVRELVQKADGDVELAEYGIIYLDEVDKLASKPGTGGRDVSGRGVQTTLLKLMEETEVPLTNPMDMRAQMKAMMQMRTGSGSQKDTINTRHILFIVSGAFSGLEKVVQSRLKSGHMGFGAEISEAVLDGETFREVETRDLVDFGFEAEFVGRLPVRVICEKLTADDFVKILNDSEGSILRQYEREFSAYGIAAKFEPDAIRYVAELAEKEDTGARALMTVLERLLRDFKFELPGTAVSELVINRDLLDNREAKLKEFAAMEKRVDVKKTRAEVEIWEREFNEKHEVNVHLNDQAVVALAEKAAEQARSVLQVCRDRFKDYQFGLKLIEKNTGRKDFELTPEAVADPDKFLSEMVVLSYRRDSEAGSPSADDA
ncbi:AAA family ATPase [Roseibacillus ishigakijimensis]|uniref:AAA family ATPase n=1 Tax=Roseibacillus ishigakijimensis TaxID=454146 RepID=A0A934RTJ4_9BACT|nr:AAA family ATPase [Roseibacillus ishigakijimensis]MBK1834246.1 AAA family ATPase [Roseibacillus ishigakijimensis]